MKNYFIKIFVVAILVGGLAFNYSGSGRAYTMEDVVKAMDAGNAGQLSNYFDKIVEITLHDKTNSYSRSQAEVILKDFFSFHDVRAFRIVHKGSESGAEFCIGNLDTRYGQFRTAIFMKSRAQHQVLQEISFQENN